MKWRTVLAKPAVRTAALVLVGALGAAGLLPEACAAALRSVLLGAGLL